ncbi:MAG: cytochrome c nitrite reductase small subunit [Planctomycetaceae bacterium]
MKKRIWGTAAIGCSVLLGSFVGAGSYTFHYGEGFSYFRKDPASCVNCHIMQPHYDTWLKSSHHAVANCIDCHLPHEFPHDFIAKAENGWNHSWAFTFDDFPEPIRMTARNRRTLEDNCKACHGPLTDQMLADHHRPDERGAVSCLHCHSNVGHTAPPR